MMPSPIFCQLGKVKVSNDQENGAITQSQNESKGDGDLSGIYR